MQEARVHLGFACKLYELQHRSGRAFIHEHPAYADSWREPCIKRLVEMPGVQTVLLDMCQYNLTTKTEDGATGLVKKTTKLITNNRVMAKH